MGLCGIVVRETANTFDIIGKDDRLRSIPKLGCVFSLDVPRPNNHAQGAACKGAPTAVHHAYASAVFLVDVRVTLYGDNIRLRAHERAVRKARRDLPLP